jgi:hypothetical protein
LIVFSEARRAQSKGLLEANFLIFSPNYFAMGYLSRVDAIAIPLSLETPWVYPVKVSPKKFHSISVTRLGVHKVEVAKIM